MLFAVQGNAHGIQIFRVLDVHRTVVPGTEQPKQDAHACHVLGIVLKDLVQQGKVPCLEVGEVPLRRFTSREIVQSRCAEYLFLETGQRAGLQAGCIITAFNGEPIATMEELQEALAGCSAGDSVTITASFPSGNSYISQELSTILGSKSDAENIFGSESTGENDG